MQVYKIFKKENSSFVDYSIWFNTDEELDNFVAKFPKYVRIIKTRGFDQTRQGGYPIAAFVVDLESNGIAGEVNETGLKRLAKFREIADLDSMVETGVRA